MLITCPIKLIGSLTRRLFVKGHQITEYYLIKTAIQLVTKQRIMFVCNSTVCMNDLLGMEWSDNLVLVRGEEHLRGVLDWLPTVHLLHSSNLGRGEEEGRRGGEQGGRRGGRECRGGREEREGGEGGRRGSVGDGGRRGREGGRKGGEEGRRWSVGEGGRRGWKGGGGGRRGSVGEGGEEGEEGREGGGEGRRGSVGEGV